MTTVTLYIEPDQGPIKPVDLDLLVIEEMVLAAHPPIQNREQERLKIIGDQIKKRFARVQPESNQAGLSHILARFSHASQFNGMVLHLAGEIDPDPQKPSKGTPATSLTTEVDRLVIEVRNLRGQLQNEKNANVTDKARVVQVEDAYRQLTQQRQRDAYEISTLQQQLQQGQDELRRARDDLAREQQRLQADVATATRAHAAVQTQYEQLKIQHDELQKRLQQRDNELATLRIGISQNQQRENLLKATITEREDEIQRLREQLDRLTQSTPAMSSMNTLIDDMLP